MSAPAAAALSRTGIAVAAFLLSGDASFVTGAQYVVDGARAQLSRTGAMAAH